MGLASRRRHEQHTYLTRFAKAAPLAATVTKLKRETIPEFLSQRKLWRLLFAGLGKTTVGTALTLQDDSIFHQPGSVATAHIYDFTEQSLLTHVWQTETHPDGHQHQMSQLEVLRRNLRASRSSTYPQSDKLTVVLVVRLVPDEVKVTILLISLAIILGFTVAMATSDVANGMAPASALFALYSSVHSMPVLIRSHKG
ncbi:hypothetical protein ACCO45_012812 [Purpureocillium lilacinum]|uniref:Uncharacterized protein n=1 Tax=Purpureocillium lilacinum TaxID=33203 RepID=A0ACC4DAL2_PURLI